MRPYTNDYSAITGTFTPLPWLDRSTSYAPITETGPVPGAPFGYSALLDYAVLKQAGFSVTVGGLAKVIVPWSVAPNSAQVAVDFDNGRLWFHASADGAAVSVNYTPWGSPLVSDFINRMQKAVAGAAPASHNHSAAQITSGTLVAARGGTGVTTGLSALNAGSLNAGTVPDARLSSQVARRDQANTFTAAQTFTGGVVESFREIPGAVSIALTDVVLYASVGTATVTWTLPSTTGLPIGKKYRIMVAYSTGTVNLTTSNPGGGEIINPNGTGWVSSFSIPCSTTKFVEIYYYGFKGWVLASF